MTDRLRTVSWDAFQVMDTATKAQFFNTPDGTPIHVILAQQFGRQQMDSLGLLATRIRRIAKSEQGMRFLRDQLPHKRAMLYFTQPSTRTFLSFCSACEILGICIGEVRDTATSSEFKGETQEDSVRSFSSYFDLVVMRTQTGGLAERMAWVLSNTDRTVPVINAGSGKDQHPTQALLDIYTLQRSFENRGGIDGTRIAFVGDLARGRTVRSLSLLLTQYRNVEQYFVAPEPLQIGRDILAILDAAGVRYHVSGDLPSVVPVADAVYMTRIQDEWDDKKGDSAAINTDAFVFRPEFLDLLGHNAVIMHPLPRRGEIPTAIDRDPRAVYWRQMRNGMWIRTALIARIFRKEDAILDYPEPDT